MATKTKPKIRLKLLVDNSSRKVVFAEAGKDFVDFLFGLLELPLGTILSILANSASVSVAGSGLGRVYKSLVNLDSDYLQSDEIKSSLLIPKITTGSNTKPNPFLDQLAFDSIRPQSFYGHGFRSSNPDPPKGEGIVKGAVTYMVMDDLTLKPISTISTISRLNSLKVNIESPEEKTVEIDMDQGVKLLEASFQSSTILTDLFLVPKKRRAV